MSEIVVEQGVRRRPTPSTQQKRVNEVLSSNLRRCAAVAAFLIVGVLAAPAAAGALSAVTPVNLDEGIPDLRAIAEVYRDASGAKPFALARSAPYQSFRSLPPVEPYSARRRGALWLRFSAEPSKADAFIVLPERVRRGEVVVVRPDGTSDAESFGSAMPVAQRPFGSDLVAARLPAAPDGGTYFVRVAPGLALDAPVAITNEAGLAARDRERIMLVVLPAVVIAAAVLAVALIAILLGYLLRDASFGAYAGTLVVFTAYEIFTSGVLGRWFLPHATMPDDALAAAIRALYFVALLVFCVVIGDRTIFAIRAKLFAAAFFGAMVVGELLYLVWPEVIAASHLYAVLAPVLTTLFLIATFSMLIGDPRKLTFIRLPGFVAFVATLCGFVLYRGSYTGLFGPSVLASDAIGIAIVVQASMAVTVFARHIQGLAATAASIVSERSQLEDAALRDVLTGIPNRRAFEQRLPEEWRRASRSNEPISVILIDVDNFKAYNDTFGHTGGDEVLGAVARTIAMSLRGREDFVARYGGEEFAVVLPSCPDEEGGRVAERLCDEIRHMGIPHPGSQRGVLTISAGVASANPRRMRRARLLVERADAALYVAKQMGRDRVSINGSVAFTLPPPSPVMHKS